MKETHVTHRDLAERYFANVRARNVEGLAALFTPDAEMVLPDGRVLPGVEAIWAMYTQLFATTPPTPTAESFIVGSNGVAVELVARFADGSVRRTANLFYTNDEGLVRRLCIYARET
jgi:hypothetical protein